jgi:hypothetical protein
LFSPVQLFRKDNIRIAFAFRNITFEFGVTNDSALVTGTNKYFQNEPHSFLPSLPCNDTSDLLFLKSSQISRFIPVRIKKGHEGTSHFKGALTFVAFIIFNYVTPAIKSWGAMPVGLYLNFGNNVSDFSRSYKKKFFIPKFFSFVNVFPPFFFSST